MSPAPRVIFISGATGGLGAALAREYAAPGVLLLLQGRDAAALDTLTSDCRKAGAGVQPALVDCTGRADWQAYLDGEVAAARPELVCLCAGVNSHPAAADEPEPWPVVERLFEINLRANLAVVAALLPGMLERGSGQLALFSSLAAWHGLPLTPAYSASKAALKAYGEALRGGLAGRGIRVSVVMPGYVESAMCRAMPGPKPWLWPADRAARAIRRGLAADRARITFPWLLATGTWALAVLPAPLAGWLLRFFGYGR